VQQFRQEAALPPAVIDQCAIWLESVWDDVQADRLVLINGDVTEDHVLVRRQNGVWCISGLIDFADALVGQVEYEWIALWFGALDRDVDAMRTCMAAYDPCVQPDGVWAKRVMAFTLLHEFGAGIVRSVLERMGSPRVRSFDSLVNALWGNLIEGGIRGI
jgi:hygromycin-B 7''-O-kinase